MELLNLLNNPDREFSMIPFWFLNGDLDDDEIKRQLNDFCKHGVYGVVLHPRIGLPDRIGYLSETFFHYIRTAVEEAARLDMKIVLYDEGMYPSGSACGQVVCGHPELASRGIALVDSPNAQDIVLAKTDGKYLVERASNGTIRGIHFGEDDGEPNAPKSADILNPVAVDRFLELTHEAYYREFSDYFGNTIIGFFTDEPSILGRNAEYMFPWTRGFADEFVQNGGSLEKLAGLFKNEENPSTKLYHEMILEKESNIYYKKLSNWCENHGISLMGHPHQSDDIEVEKWFHVPGQDLVLRWVAPEKGALYGIDSTMGHCSADAALLAGRRRNSNECFGACNKDNNPWQLSGGDIKWYIDWLAVRGVNMFIPHAFYYSIEGERKGERPPDVGSNNIWWSHYELFSGYMQRLSALMCDTKTKNHVAVLCSNRNLVPNKAAELMTNQVGFHYIPESFWKDCRVENGKLVYKNLCFDSVVGDENLFPEVPHGFSDKDRDVVISPSNSNLRVAHFERFDTECWLLVNEGDSPICGKIKFPTARKLGCYDLWKRQCFKADFDFELSLSARESLLVFACTDSEYAKLGEKKELEILRVNNWTLESEDTNRVQKKYKATIDVKNADEICIEVDAIEMAELYINGEFADVSFFAPYRFATKNLLKSGVNNLELIVTGSLANIYGRKPVWYGVDGKEAH
jgi:hypothetical protein